MWHTLFAWLLCVSLGWALTEETRMGTNHTTALHHDHDVTGAAVWHDHNVTTAVSSLLRDLSARNATHAGWNCASTQLGALLPKDLCGREQDFKCMSASEMLQFVPQSSSVGDALSGLCPLILMQMTHPACSPALVDATDSRPLKPSTLSVWGYGLLFVTAVSGCSLLGVAALPFLGRRTYRLALLLFEGLAVGSLVGSALFHLIPQSFNMVDHVDHHDYLWRSLLVFGGIYLFYVSERCMKMVMDVRERKKAKSRFALSESSTEFLKPPCELTGDAEFTKGEGEGHFQILNNGSANYKKIVPDTAGGIENGHAKSFFKNGELPLHHHHHDHGGPAVEQGQGVATVAWMIILGDGLHNFIDGLSMGAAFSESILAGISISVAVICEELPHELGDFAVLLSSGMSVRQALGYNFLSAATCYVGLCVGIALGELVEAAPYMFALAAGMFLYIALVDMLNELNAALEEARPKGIAKQLKVFAIQNVGILLGIVALFAMARYASHFNFTNIGDLSSPAGGAADGAVQMYSGEQEARNLQSLLTA